MELDVDNLHHAYLLVGDAGEAHTALLSFFSSKGVKLTGSPDFFISLEPVFGINEARLIATSALRRAFGNRKVFLIAPEKITLEAQNALLKTFEEPIENTHFFLVVREEELIIPTLRSRMEKIKLQHSVLQEEAGKFLKLEPADRLKFVKKFVDNERNLSVFLDELLLVLHSNRPTGFFAFKKNYQNKTLY